MRKTKTYKFITEYGSRIKTIGIICVLFFMIIAVKTYMNYNSIIQEITKVNSDIETINQEIAYSKNFYEKYLDSDYVSYFLAHKNNTLFYNESIIRLIDPTIKEQEVTNSGSIIQNPIKEKKLSPQEAWIQFFKSKLN